MLELLLFAILVMLVLIYFQLKKNIKGTDSYFAAIDLSLRQFFANLSTTEGKERRAGHEEILSQLRKIADESGATARILNEVHHPKSIEDEYYESEQTIRWQAKAKAAKEKMTKGKDLS